MSRLRSQHNKRNRKRVICNTANDVPSTLETSIIFAMVIYGILALAVSALINWLSARIGRLDAEELRERQWIMRERELQAISDRAAIARSQQATNGPILGPGGILGWG